MSIDVVLRHLDAVRRGDVVAMAADYGNDAVIVRGADNYRGRDAIAAYFATVPDRLGGHVVELDAPIANAAGEILVRWRIAGRNVSGSDRFVVADGLIAEQHVELDGDDF